MKKTIYPSAVGGSVSIPASKSHTIRAVLIAGLADGTSTLRFPLESNDPLAAVRACGALGVEIDMHNDFWSIKGTAGQLRPPATPIDVGNSGTSLYLLAGMASLADFPVTFTGDEQICRRSAAPLLDALRDLGVAVESASEGCAPFTIRGPLQGGSTSIECPTSQYLSSLLLAAPLSSGDTEIEVPLLYERPYIDMTLDWLDAQSISYKRSDYRRFSIPGGQRYRAFDRRIPGDFSSASFFMVAAAITGSRIELHGLDMTDTQGDKEVVSVLERMGCKIEQIDSGLAIEGAEQKALQGGLSGGLQGGSFDLNNIPDALPALAVAACFSNAVVELGNVPQARQKETDRIAVMKQELSKLGANIEELEDGLIIHGTGTLQGGKVAGHGDHRVIMALAVAGLAAEGPISIDDAAAAAVTFPDFFKNLEEIGAKVLIE
ncbi:MAG: 3-phosphoshikimate 1-carboxyvinyltransferase [Spirochaetia bacterium]|nr:3-phosphoshikimate 1-carboxyvinyltransferase [Spirochaetia bacterium]